MAAWPPSSTASARPTANRSLARSGSFRLPRIGILATSLLFWATVFAFASPANAVALGGGVGLTSGPPAAPHAVAGSTAHLTTAVGSAVGAITLPGSNPRGQAYQSNLAESYQSLADRALWAQNWSLVGSNPAAAGARLQALDSTASPSQSATVTPATGRIAAGTVTPTGTVTGTVELSTSHAPLPGVSVQAYSATGTSNCAINICKVTSTNASGGFSAIAPVGADYIQYTLNYNLTNITYVTVAQGITSSVGTVFMVPEAVVTGYTDANTSSHPHLVGVQVIGTSRDNTLVGLPQGASNGAGYFIAAVPPVPSILTFQPPFGYESTFLFVNATPGEHFSVGTVYIQKDPVVTLKIYDAVTKSAVPTGTCTYFLATQCNAITVCSAITPSVCGGQGQATGSPQVTAVGPAGYDVAKVWSTGYVTNTVYLGYVPYNSGTFNFGSVYLTPLGTTKLTVDLTHNLSTTIPRWPTGYVTASACSLNGLYSAGISLNPTTYTVNVTQTSCTGSCGNPNSPYTFATIPLRIDIKVAPDTQGNCGGPPTWPIPDSLPAWGNETWYNITPDEVTTVWSNFTLGDYVAGNLSVPAGGKIPNDFTITPTSTDNPSNFASYPFQASVGSTAPCNSADRWLPSAANGGFCVAVPPGASKLIVSTSLSPYGQNFTWGGVPRMCCAGSYPIAMTAYNVNHFGTINLTSLGAVHGKVLAANTGAGVFFASYQVNAAGSVVGSPSFDGAVALNGTIYSSAPFGWDSITVSASGYSPDTVWANVNGNVSFGNVSLYPLATIAGQVVDQYGNGILGATLHYCPVAQTSPVVNCNQLLGAGLATTDGAYNGTVEGLWLPYSTYEIYASSSGYTSSWTWVNASQGQTIIAPTLVLYSSTAGARPADVGFAAARTVSGPTAGAGGGNPSPQTYVSGYLIDNSTGQGLEVGGGSIQACSTATGTCYSMLPGTNSQGLFNGSIPLGTYTLLVNPPGYKPVTMYINVSSGAFNYIGVIQMYPLPFVNGNVQINPFGEISVLYHSSYVQIPEVPGANALACNANGTICGTSLPVESNGSFTVLTPAGTYDHIGINPSGGATGPSSNGGFDSNQTTFNASANVTTVLNGTLLLWAYVLVGGQVMDNTTYGPGGLTPWLGVPYASVVVNTNGKYHGTVSYTTTASGGYEMFLPPNPLARPITVVATSNVYDADGALINTSLPETDPPVVTMLPTLGLHHYGWVTAEVLTGPNGTPSAFLSASVASSSSNTTSGGGLGLGETNAFGQLNATAPYGIRDTLTLAPANDYNGSQTTVDVNMSETTFVGGGSPLQLGYLYAAHWGWYTSLQTNFTGTPVHQTVLDKVTGLPLPGALLTVSSSDSAYVGTGTNTNWAGQFVADAPIGPDDSALVTRPGALSNTTKLSIAPGQTVNQTDLNLTGVGILTGSVVAYPSGTPISGATVQTCPTSTGTTLSTAGCYYALTNVTGQFWVAAFPGQVTISTSAVGYVENTSSQAKSCSDCWNALGPIVLSEFSYITGSVYGLPRGLPLQGANVSLCSAVGGNPIGSCQFGVSTDINGNFVLEAPAGTYNVVANATGYNASVPLPVTLRPGEVLPLGTRYLEQFGNAQGAVLSALTLQPIGNASLFPCATWSGGSCLPTVQSSSTGTFVLSGAPGPYTLSVSAPGYQVAYVTILLKAGETNALSPILLKSLGTPTYFQVSGEVVNATQPSEGLLDAHIFAEVNGTAAFTATTDSHGDFSFQVLYGTYDLVAASPGFAPVNRTLTVNGPQTGLVFSLSEMTYLFQSTITDGLTGTPLPGATIAENGIVSGVADGSGFVSFALANGTHTLVASDPSSSGVEYSPVDFSIFVDGAPVLHDLQLEPPTITTTGVVVDAISGAPIGGATVVIRGLTTDGVPVSQSASTNPAGQFTATLTVGTYNASVTSAGYDSRIVAFTVTTATGPISILMTPTVPVGNGNGVSQAPSGNAVEWTLIAVVGLVILAALLGTVLLTRRRGGGDSSDSSAVRPAAPPSSRGNR